MNNLSKAAEILKTSWCQSRWREDLPEGQKFCSGGALMEAMGLLEHIPHGEFSVTMPLDEAREILENSPEAKVLSDVILENYPEVKEPKGYCDCPSCNEDRLLPLSIIVNFNDGIAENSEQVVQMFEKAAVKWDEQV